MEIESRKRKLRLFSAQSDLIFEEKLFDPEEALGWTKAQKTRVNRRQAGMWGTCRKERAS